LFNDATGPFLFRGFNKIMSVEIIAFNGDKSLPGQDFPGINRDPFDLLPAAAPKKAGA
jgi:hypothetical protein